MIDATQAIQIAEEKLPKVVPTFAALHPHVEEIEQTNNGQEWLITFRAENPASDSDFGGSFVRYFEKVVRVGTTSGELLSVLNPSYR